MDPYLDIAAITADTYMQRRIAACCAQQGQVRPEDVAYAHRYRIAAQPGWGAAWASATVAGSEYPGAAPDVISDGMILAAVQAVLGA